MVFKIRSVGRADTGNQILQLVGGDVLFIDAVHCCHERLLVDLVDDFDTRCTHLFLGCLFTRHPHVAHDRDGVLGRLADSGLILGYLLARHGRAMPAAAGDWERARRLTIAEGVVDACAAIVLEGRRPTGQRSQAHVDRQRGVIARGLAAVATEPPEQSPADADPYAITVAVLLGYLDFRLPTVDWRSSAPSLAGWYADAAALPAMQATRPPEG